jgi:hypothetical protein
LFWIEQVSGPLHQRLAWRLLFWMTGMLFAQGRGTVAGWLKASELGPDYKRYYYLLGSLGRKVEWVALRLLRLMAARLPLGDRLLFGIDGTSTKRTGSHVEGAGIYHHPTPGNSCGLEAPRIAIALNLDN